MSNKLLILGAGFDKGIGMPLANELVPEINNFLLETDLGKAFDNQLKNMLPNLRFSYDKFIKSAVDKLATDFKKEVNSISRSLKNEIDTNTTLDDKSKSKGKLIINLLSKIRELQNNVKIDKETEELIKNVFPEYEIEEDNIINLPKLSFSKVFEYIMESFFEESLKSPNDPILKHIYRNFMDLENLLLTHFIGFYNQESSHIKKYLYIAWTLWAYLVTKEKEIDSKSLYNFNTDNLDIINFNYTSFAQGIKTDTIYFHGQLSKFINLEDRQLCNIDQYANSNFPITNFLDNIIKDNLDFENKKFVIPALIPPLKLKPVLSNDYIDIWHQSQEKIKKAIKIIIIGYSFNYADEHFNDIIRNNKDKEIIIIDPNIDTIIKNIRSIFNYSNEDYTKNSISGKDSYEKGNLKIIQSKAEDFNINEI